MDKKKNGQPPVTVPEYIPNGNISENDGAQNIPEPNNLNPQSNKSLPQSVFDKDDLGTPLDVFGRPDHSPPMTPGRHTRSGRAYSSILRQTFHVCQPNLESAKPSSVFGATDPRPQATGLECSTFNTSIQASPVCPTLTDSLLIPELKTNYIPALVDQDDSEESHLPKKVVKFSSKRNLRLFSENTDTFSDISQVCARVETKIKKFKTNSLSNVKYLWDRSFPKRGFLYSLLYLPCC